ncbi:hypothetical protein EG329_008960 [Mollisiaceae sp. DMI_Dod_QoI]|nr:hypothetical protein EG329_008960 [Helotiales sp. DMI_Dod_QoI]
MSSSSVFVHDRYIIKPLASSSFTLFPILPKELRLQIWELAYVPRNVSVPLICDTIICLESLDVRSHFAHLFVNHEAHELFLQRYPRIFIDHIQPNGQAGGWYFNYKLDSLCMVTGVLGLKYFLNKYPEEMRHVRYLDLEPTSRLLVGNAFVEAGPIVLLGSGIQLHELEDLRLITIRNIVTGRQSVHSYTLLPTIFSLVTSLCRRTNGRWCKYTENAKLAVANFLWIEGDDEIFESLKNHVLGTDWPLSDEVKERWDLLGISQPKMNPSANDILGSMEVPIDVKILFDGDEESD